MVFKTYRILALALVFAVMFGMLAAMAPATAQASDMGCANCGKMHNNRAAFSPNQLPNPFVRDFDGDCVWWRYELRNGRYVRTYCPCRYGDAEVDYEENYRRIWYESANSVVEQ